MLDRLGRGAMMRHAAKQMRTADDASYERLKRLAHGIGPAVILHEGSTLIVVANALRLLAYQPTTATPSASSERSIRLA